MFLIKAHEFISAKNPRAAERFIDDHSWSPGAGIGQSQSVLNDLAAWNHSVLPYMQDLPARCRAIMLEAAAEGGTFWADLDR
jgi:hypothetical protein